MRNLLIIIMTISWIVKMGIHYHLDLKSGRRTGLPPADMIPIHYFFPYVEPLDKMYLKERKVCNFFYWLAIFTTLGIFLFIYLFQEAR